MALTILDPTVAANVAAALDQTAQRAALLAPWAGGPVTVQSRQGATLRDAVTYGAWVLDSSTPRGATLGARQAGSVTTTGAPDRFVFRAGSTDIFSVTAAVSPGVADVVLPAAGAGVRADARTSLVDAVLGSFRVSADPALPVASVGATALTLSVPSSGTNSVPAAVTITPNGPIPGGGLSVTLALSGGGTLGATSFSFTGGSTAAQTTTLTRSTAGTSTVTMTNTGGLANTGSPAGFTSSAPVSAGIWQQLTVAPHSRKVISTSSPSDGDTYEPNAVGAQTDVEALVPQTVSAIPGRGYNVLVRGGVNELYIAGSLHSGYRGNEIDRITVPTRAADGTVASTRISHQPNSPPKGPNSGYAAGLGGYIYKVTHAPAGVVGFDDQTEAANWQPFWGHDWTMVSWTPYTDVCTMLAHAVQDSYPNGAYSIIGGILQSSGNQPSDGYTGGTRQAGLVYFDWATNKYKTLFSQLSSFFTSLPSGGYPFSDQAYGLGTNGLADWNNWDQSLLLFNSISGSMNVVRWNPTTGLTVLASMLGSDNTVPLAGLGSNNGHSGNGDLIRHLELRKYLGLSQSLSGRAGIRLWLYSEMFKHSWTGSISGTTMTVTALANDQSVIVGRHVQGTGVAAGTRIEEFLTGTNGRLGTYRVSISQTVASTAMSNTPADRVVDLTPQLPGSGTGQPFNGLGSACDPLTFTVDKNSRRVFWLVAGNGIVPRLYVSDFDHLMEWTQITHTGLSAWADGDVWNILDRQVMHFLNGYLILHDNAAGPGNPGYQAGAMNLKRVKVDAGEDLPAMNYTRYDYGIQNFTVTGPGAGVYGWANAKHCNFAYNPADNKHYYFAGDCGGSTSQCVVSLQFSGNNPGDYTFTQVLGEVSPLGSATGTIRPVSADDGHWCLIPSDSAWVAGRGKFMWVRGGDGEGMFWNQYIKTLYGAAEQTGTLAQMQAALADGWDLSSKLYLFDPVTSTFSNPGPTRTLNTALYPSDPVNAFPVTNYNGWTQDNGSGGAGVYVDVWTTSSAASRNGYFDSTTGTLWRFYDNGSQFLMSFNFNTKVVKVFNITVWFSPETGTNWFGAGAIPASEGAIISDGTKPKFGYVQTDNGRQIHPRGFNHEHKATWIDERDGKLYVVSPQTGYLWCYETRGAHTDSGNGWSLPFYPVGSRVPLVGCLPVLNSRDRYPPMIFTGVDPDPSGSNGESRMNSFLVPFKGGLLYWSNNHHYGGVFGNPAYAFWRRLGYTGDWTVVSMPQELTAQSHSVISRAHDNSEVVMLCGGGNYEGFGGRQPWFWRLT